MNDRENFLMENMEKINLRLQSKQIEQMLLYYEMIVKKNKVMNLTAITEYEEAVMKHFIDSLSIIRIIDINEINSIIDIGTGAGFPGVPLKIVFPELKVTLVDSLKKRIIFLQEVIDCMNLNDTEAIHVRAEDLAKKKQYRENYDLAVSRAVAKLSTLSEYCIPFVKVGGFFVSYKAKNVEDEIQTAKRALKILGGELDKCDQFSIFYKNEIIRSLIMIKKTKTTSMKYPRKAGIPSSNPL